MCGEHEAVVAHLYPSPYIHPDEKVTGGIGGGSRECRCLDHLIRDGREYLQTEAIHLVLTLPIHCQNSIVVAVGQEEGVCETRESKLCYDRDGGRDWVGEREADVQRSDHSTVLQGCRFGEAEAQANICPCYARGNLRAVVCVLHPHPRGRHENSLVGHVAECRPGNDQKVCLDPKAAKWAKLAKGLSIWEEWVLGRRSLH